MVKPLASYKGVWNPKTEGQHGAMRTTDRHLRLPMKPAPTARESTQAPRESVSLPPLHILEHRYRLMLLQEHRHKLGHDLLHATRHDPWQHAWQCLTSAGQSFRPWAHERMFALSCFLGVDMPPEILRQLRHPIRLRHYRRSILGLWRLLAMLAKKSGEKPAASLGFSLFYVFPPLGVWLCERELQNLLAKTHSARETLAAAVFNDPLKANSV